MDNREIDARVAREVMGWVIHDAIPNEFKTPLIFDFENEGTLLVSREYDDGFKTAPWSPSTDMNAAMEVVNKLVGRDTACISLEWSPNGEHRWSAVFIMDGDKISSWACGDADTPALTICLAALEAVKNNKEG